MIAGLFLHLYAWFFIELHDVLEGKRIEVDILDLAEVWIQLLLEYQFQHSYLAHHILSVSQHNS